MDVTKTLKDAALITIGFGVLGFQKVQVRRRELEKQFEGQRVELRKQFEEQTAELRKQFEGQATELRAQLAKVADGVEERLEPYVGAVETSLDQLEERLPDQAREAVKSARTAAKEAGEQLRARLNAVATDKSATTNGKAA